MEAETVHRLQFAFTITYHYLFPQITMGLALILAVWKGQYVLGGDEAAGRAVRFWSRPFAVCFVMGVVTGIPMEFQFGTNWARFSEGAGNVVGQTLAMEGVFAFFLESAFVYLLVFGEKRLSPRAHLAVTVLVAFGTWLSGYFIVATNAFMQHPVGFAPMTDGRLGLDSLAALLTNPWLRWQYPHTMLGSVVTASFLVAALGAFYRLGGRHDEQARLYLRTGVAAGLIGAVLVAFPTGDMQSKNVLRYQPITFAAMEGHFQTEEGAGLVIIGQPDMERMAIDNPIVVPRMLSFMTHMRWSSEIKGLTEYPRDEWPTNVPLLYYAYHVMVGLGTMFIALMALAAAALWRRRLYDTPPVLWALLLAFPFPFIANTAGWVTAESGRQPWLIHGVMRTADGFSTNVSAGNALFTLIGFMGLYTLLSLLFILVMLKTIAKGPDEHVPA